MTEWIWANPHCFLKFDAKDDTGTVRNWAVEVSNPTDMTRAGLGADLVQGRRRGHRHAAAGQERRAGRPPAEAWSCRTVRRWARGRTRRAAASAAAARQIDSAIGAVASSSPDDGGFRHAEALDCSDRRLASAVLTLSSDHRRAADSALEQLRAGAEPEPAAGGAGRRRRPRRDLTGIWDAGGAGIGARGYQTVSAHAVGRGARQDAQGRRRHQDGRRSRRSTTRCRRWAIRKGFRATCCSSCGRSRSCRRRTRC